MYVIQSQFTVTFVIFKNADFIDKYINYTNSLIFILISYVQIQKY